MRADRPLRAMCAGRSMRCTRATVVPSTRSCAAVHRPDGLYRHRTVRAVRRARIVPLMPATNAIGAVQHTRFITLATRTCLVT